MLHLELGQYRLDVILLDDGEWMRARRHSAGDDFHRRLDEYEDRVWRLPREFVLDVPHILPAGASLRLLFVAVPEERRSVDGVFNVESYQDIVICVAVVRHVVVHALALRHLLELGRPRHDLRQLVVGQRIGGRPPIVASDVRDLEVIVYLLSPAHRRLRPFCDGRCKRRRACVFAPGDYQVHSSPRSVLKMSENSSPVSFVIPLTR